MAQGATLFQLGMDLGCEPRKAQTEAFNVSDNVTVLPVEHRSPERPGAGSLSESDERKDHFIVRDGRCYAGTHLIIDLWEAERLDELEHVENALVEAVQEAGATLLHIHLHHFTPNGGISGVAVLAESHISIHSWPERGYAALDVFMCGDAEPRKAIPVLERAFKPGRVVVGEFFRGEDG